MPELRDLKELRELVTDLDRAGMDQRVIREALRPKELDYMCEIAAILFAYGICGYEDLPEIDEECD